MIELCKLSIRYMKEKWTQTLVVMIGSMLSVVLITGVILLNNALQVQKDRSFTMASGAWAFRITSQDTTNINPMKIKNIDVNDQVRINHLGFIVYDNQSFIEVKDYSAFRDLQPVFLKNGEYPNRDREILISSQYQKSHNIQVGDTLQYDVGKRLNENRKEIDSSRIEEDEQFTEINTMEFVVSGIYTETKTPSDSVIKDTFITISDQKTEIQETYYAINKISSSSWDLLTKSLPTNAMNEVSKDIFINVEMHISVQELIIFSLAFLVLGTNLFMFTKNIFAIFLQQKRKFIGMLQCCGAKEYQIIILSIVEAIWIGFISVPCGIILAYGLIQLLLNAMNQVLFSQTIEYVLQIHFENVLYLENVLSIILISFALLILSSLLPLKRMLKKQPLELLQENDIQILNSKIKLYPRYEQFFHISAMLGKLSQYCNRKKYRSICFTLIISIIMFMCGNFISNSLSNSMNHKENGIEVVLPPFKNINDVQKMQDAIQDLSKINKHGTTTGYYSMNVVTDKIPLGFWDNTAYVEYLEENPQISVYTLIDSKQLPATLKQEHRVILLNDAQMVSKKGTLTSIEVFSDERIQDTLPITDRYFIGDNTWHTETLNFEIMDIEDSLTYGIEKVNLEEDEQLYWFAILVNPSDFDALLSMYESRAQVSEVILTMQNKNKESLLSRLQTYKELHPYQVTKIKNLQQTDIKEQSLLMIYQLIFSSFALLAFMIGSINLLNTVISNLLSQRKTYAVLQSVGMNGRDMHVMLLFENMSVIVKALLGGIFLSIVVNYILYNMIFYKYGSFSIDWIFIIAISVFIMMVSLVTILVGNYIMNRHQTIYDAMKHNE